MTNNHGCSLGSGTERKRSNPGVSMTEGVVAAEILSRLPVRSLMRFRYVCKSWRDLISDPYFVKKHLDRSRRKPQLVVVPFSVTGGMRNIGFYACTPGLQARLLFELKKFSEVQETVEHPQHVDGLVLLDTGTRLHVCNPSTGEFLAIPESSNVPLPSAPRHRSGLGYAARDRCYKVVQYFYRRRDFAQKTFSLGLEVFELGGSGDSCWRVVDSDPPYAIDTSTPPSSIGGVVYFMINNHLHAPPPKGILAFNLNDEKFKVIDGPPSLSSLDCCQITELEGELCLARTSVEPQKLDVWSYCRKEEEEGGRSWVHAYSINLLEPWTDADPIEVRQGKLLLHVIRSASGWKHSLELYDPQTGLFHTVAATLKQLEYSKRPCLQRYSSKSFRLIKYVESLASIKGVTSYDGP